jgi:hypothetical protein
MPLYTIVNPGTCLDDLVNALDLGTPSPFHEDKRATLLKYKQATGLESLRNEMISLV